MLFEFDKIDPHSFFKKDLIYNRARLNESPIDQLDLLEFNKHLSMISHEEHFSTSLQPLKQLGQLGSCRNQPSWVVTQS